MISANENYRHERDKAVTQEREWIRANQTDGGDRDEPTPAVKGKSKTEPVMTRLNAEELAVLDALVGGGVARSRSAAMSWCVRLVQTEHEPWLVQLQHAVAHLHKMAAPPAIKERT